MRILKVVAAVLFVGVLILVGAAYFMSEPRPTGEAVPEADELAREMETAVHKEAWDRTGAVRWSFFKKHHYVWDRKNGLVELRWGNTRALLRTGDKTGRVWSKDSEVPQCGRIASHDEAQAQSPEAATASGATSTTCTASARRTLRVAARDESVAPAITWMSRLIWRSGPSLRSSNCSSQRPEGR